MKRDLLVLVFCLLGASLVCGASIDHLTSSNLSEFSKTFSRDLHDVDQVFKQLSDSKLPLFDEAGRPEGQRRIKDRRQTVADIEKTLEDFKKTPRNLVVTMTLSAQTGELADEVYDVSQVAFDNDQEELAMQLTGLLDNVNDDASLIQADALGLAAQKEQRLRTLEQEHPMTGWP